MNWRIKIIVSLGITASHDGDGNLLLEFNEPHTEAALRALEVECAGALRDIARAKAAR